MSVSRIIGKLKGIDAFHRNVIIVFLGSSLVNLSNLLYQLLIAHRLPPADFASFNSLLAIFMLFSTPLGTLQTAITKFTAELNARESHTEIRMLLSAFFKKSIFLAIVMLFILSIFCGYITRALRIPSSSAGYILALLLSLSCIMPVLSGGLQGLELFGYLTSATIFGGALKIILAFVFIVIGYKISGALGALFISNLIAFFLLFLPLRSYISLARLESAVNYKKIWLYLLPIALTYGCYTVLINSDMIVVKYYFDPEKSGIYSLAQMVGKIFLFLPSAIGTVMFPRTSGLNARNMDTTHTLRRSLLYTALLCLSAIIFYNLFPEWVLKVLTGKAYPESISLGRLFGLSMSSFTLLSILTAYFLSVNDTRFIKYLVFLTLLQVAAIILIGKISLFCVQVILCINAGLLLVTFFALLPSRGSICRT